MMTNRLKNMGKSFNINNRNRNQMEVDNNMQNAQPTLSQKKLNMFPIEMLIKTTIKRQRA